MPSLAVDEGDRARRGGGELVLDQREMGAGEHDRVDPLAARLAEQAVEDAGIGGGIGRLAAQLGLGQLDQLGRAVADERGNRRANSAASRST